PRDGPLRGQHLVRAADPRRRDAHRARRRHGHPQSRARARRRGGAAEHPPDPSASRPHPGPDVLRARLPPRRRARHLGTQLAHRGPTLGYRIEDAGASVCYIPDYEPALGARLTDLAPEWISGFDLARDASLLILDCQYGDEEYPDHVGWGHSALSDALDFAH